MRDRKSQFDLLQKQALSRPVKALRLPGPPPEVQDAFLKLEQANKDLLDQERKDAQPRHAIPTRSKRSMTMSMIREAFAAAREDSNVLETLTQSHKTTPQSAISGPTRSEPEEEPSIRDFDIYYRDFDQRITDIWYESLGIPAHDVMAAFLVSDIYSPQAQVTAAAIGFKLNLPAKTAIGYLALFMALAYEKENKGMLMLFSKRKRTRYLQHKAMLQYLLPAIQKYEQNDIPTKFLEEFTSAIDRIRI